MIKLVGVLFWFLQNLESLPGMVAAIYSDDPATQLESTTQFRKLLSIGELYDHSEIWDWEVSVMRFLR